MSSGKVVIGTLGNIDDGLFEIVLINENMLEEVLIFLKDQFFTSEPLCKAINAVEKPMLLKDFAKLVTMMITKEGGGSFVSGAVVEKSTNQIISVGCGSLRPKRNNQSYFGEFAEKYCEDELAKKLLQFLDAATTKVNIYDHFNVDYLIEVNVLVTHENYRRKSFGKKFGDFVVDTVLQKNLSVFLSEYEHVLENFDNYAVRGVCTSQYSKRIANKGGCDDLCSTNLSELNLKEYADKFSKSQKVFTVGCKLTKLVLQTYASKY